jgi:hypothetical protein
MNSILQREKFAISLRKQKKEQILRQKRQKFGQHLEKLDLSELTLIFSDLTTALDMDDDILPQLTRLRKVTCTFEA